MADRPEHGEPGRPEVGRSFRDAQPYVDASWQFIASVGILTFAGYWADKHFGTTPWLLVTGAMLGFAGGLWSFLKVVMSLDKKRRQSKDGTAGEERK